MLKLPLAVMTTRALGRAQTPLERLSNSTSARSMNSGHLVFFALEGSETRLWTSDSNSP